MKKGAILFFLCINLLAFSAYAGSEDAVNITQVNLTPAVSPQAGVPFNVSASASCPSGKTIYYKFYYCANYGTASYETTPWTVVKDYSTENSAQYTFPQTGNYIIVVRAVVDPNNEPAALPIVGQAVTVSESSHVNITGLTSSSAAPNAGDEVTFTAEASSSTGDPVYYRFYYCGNYGTSYYTTTPWTMVQDYSTTNSSKYTFPSAGNYVVVVRAVTDKTNEPAALPIIGTAVTVGGGQSSTIDMNSGKWEVTTTMQIPGMSPITSTSTQCLTENDSTPDTGEQNCTTSTPVINGNTVTWSSVCQSQDCGETTSSGSITYSGDTFTGSVTMDSSCGNYTIQMSGRRIGACD